MMYSLIFLKSITYALPNVKLAALGVALIFCVIGTLFHELGHYLVGKCFGLKGMKLVFAKIKKSNVPIPFFGIYVDDSEIMKLPVLSKRIVFFAGTAFDILAAILAMSILPYVDIPKFIAIGILAATMFRFMICWVNLVPFKRLKSDGWRILNPNSD